MSGRPDLRLDAGERAAFLRDLAGSGAHVAFATAGSDGYPQVGTAGVRLTPDASGLVFPDGSGPEDGLAACVIAERGATDDDITAVVARGVVRSRTLALDDVVTFAFGKIAPTAPH